MAEFLENGSNEERFQYCFDSNGNILHIQGHSTGNRVDLSLQDNVFSPVRLDWVHLSRWFFAFLHFYSSFRSDCWRENCKEARQTVFFTTVDPMNEPQRDEPYDVKEPREVLFRTKWKVCQNAVYWINSKSAQDRRLVFWRTSANAIILDDSVPADCLEK